MLQNDRKEEFLRMTEERKCDMMNSYIKNSHNLTGSSKSPDSIAKRNKQLFGYEQVTMQLFCYSTKKVLTDILSQTRYQSKPFFLSFFIVFTSVILYFLYCLTQTPFPSNTDTSPLLLVREMFSALVPESAELPL